MRAGLEHLTIGDYITLHPTRLCIIGQPAVMTVQLAKFTVQSRSAFVRYAEYLQFDGSSPSLGFPQMKMGIIDSHCHLDKLSSHLRNEFNFWNVHGIINTSGLVQSK